VRRPTTLFPAILLLATLGAPAAPEPPKPGLLDRIVVIGASASAGHGTGREIGEHERDVPLALVLKAMIKSPKTGIVDASDAMFFIAPESTGVEQIEKAKKSEPTCVVAIDYLFWFAYGNLPSLERRQERLAKGLKLLADLDCPVLVSELPDMRRATEGRLNPRMVPDPKMLEAMNARIVAWAKARENAVLVPLAQKLADLHAGKAVRVAEITWKPPDSLAEILQKDKLHPTLMGLGMMAALSLETLAERKLVSGTEIELDARAAVKKVLAARQKATR
jgi:hypothetical protein